MTSAALRRAFAQVHGDRELVEREVAVAIGVGEDPRVSQDVLRRARGFERGNRRRARQDRTERGAASPVSASKSRS